MTSAYNSGLCTFGAPTDAPDMTGVTFPPPAGSCSVLVKYKGKAKLQKATASGKNSAKTTFTGKQVGEVTIALEWPDREPMSSQMAASLLFISPDGPNAGKAWDWTERFAGVHSVFAVMAEEMEGPTPTKGSDLMTAVIKCSTWTRPDDSGAGAGTTPADAQPYVVQGGALGAAGVTFPSKPKVLP